MTNTSHSFRHWLRQEIQQILNRHSARPPLLVWCDPERVWRELLHAAAEENSFELWAEDTHELLLRERFFQATTAPRVVWLPVGRDEISYFKVFALQAEAVWQISLPEALSRFGVDLPGEQLHELKPLLPAHAREWLDYPLAYWQEHLSPGQVKTALMDDDLFLQLLTSVGQPLSALIGPDLLPIFERRAVEDFGLPAPTISPSVLSQPKPADQWRIQALAALLVTEATVKHPTEPPGDRERLIPPGPAQEKALKLLTRWQRQVDTMASFEALAPQADAVTSLQYWARNLQHLPPPLSSPVVETTLCQTEIERLNALDSFEDLANTLESRAVLYRQHADSFWGKQALKPIAWHFLADLSAIAELLHQHTGIERQWTSPIQAIDWFVQSGWQVDEMGERLFREDYHHAPGGLVGVRAKLRQAYLFHLNQTNLVFSDLLHRASLHGNAPFELPFAGDSIVQTVAKATPKNPVAVVVLDACRFDVGQRLALRLNQGEPARRAEVAAGRAPLPSITAVGMPHTLPGLPANLTVALSPHSPVDWVVTAPGFQGNLALAGERRQWLKETFKLTDASFLTFDQILDTTDPKKIEARSLGRLAFVFEGMFDDHDQVLRPYGLDQMIDRCATVVRRLRAGGYNTIFVVTDHGFFHWEPAPDEKDLSKPDGEILWKSRRAIAGHNLHHSSALKLPVSGSDGLDCCIPRSVNAFKTYGGLGFFHGGATLQELIIPIVTITWPQKGQKIGAVLKPIEQITSLVQRVEISPAAVQFNFSGSAPGHWLARQIVAKVVDPNSGRWLFKSEAVQIEPAGDSLPVELVKNEAATANRGQMLELQLRDADDDELLDRRSVKLMVDLDEWL